jgi:hypothetical protein
VAAPADVAASYHAAQARIAQTVAVASVREWRKIDPARLDLSWLSVLLRLLAIVTAGQREAASRAPAYLAAVIRAQGVAPDPGHRLLPDPFSGIASDGRGLDTLLYSPVVGAKHAIAQGASVDDALAQAERQLAMLTQTQVQDAGRMSVQTAMADDSAVQGYLRVVHLPCCARCLILAGRWYRYSAGFQRHPNDRCTMMPAAEVIEPQDPADLLARMRKDHPAYLARSLTSGDLQALDHGADLNQVVNAHRGMATAADQIRDRMAASYRQTREGTTRRGLAGQRLRGQQRMTPAAIFAQAASENWTRQQIVAQLMRAGYLT